MYLGNISLHLVSLPLVQSNYKYLQLALDWSEYWLLVLETSTVDQWLSQT